MSELIKTSVLAVCALVFTGAAAADPLAGTWTLTIDTPRGIQHPTLEITASDAGYSGVYNSARGPIPVERIELEGQRFSFPLVVELPIGARELEYSGSVEGNTMEGSAGTPRGAIPFSGVREH